MKHSSLDIFQASLNKNFYMITVEILVSEQRRGRGEALIGPEQIILDNSSQLFGLEHIKHVAGVCVCSRHVELVCVFVPGVCN